MKARSFALIATLAAAPLAAQQPMAGPPGPGMAGQGPTAGASFLLARTGELQLTDQQVVRLAAIARREGARRRALRATIDSLRRTAPARRDSTAPRNRTIPPQLSNALTQMREQSRTDLRDAITVLTPDQQAQAWQMMSSRGVRGGARVRQPGMRQPGARQPGMRQPTPRMRQPMMDRPNRPARPS